MNDPALKRWAISNAVTATVSWLFLFQFFDGREEVAFLCNADEDFDGITFILARER